MLSRLVRIVLFQIIHILYSVWELIWTSRVIIKNEWFNLTAKWKESVNDIHIIKEYTSLFTKTPMHVVAIINTDKTSLVDLGNLVIWCLTAGVPFISFYDKKGVLKSKEEKLFQEVERLKTGIPGCIKWPNRRDLNGYSNGSRHNAITLNIFSNEDGRQRIVEFTKDVCRNKVICVRKDGDFCAENIDTVLRLSYPPVPDPDIVIYFGKYCTTQGLLPWHIRLSEFCHLNVDSNLKVNHFLGVLSKYSKCDQRFGK